MWLYVLAVPLLVYLAICAALFFGQTALLFPASSVGPGDPLPPRAERLELRAASGERLAGVHIPPVRPGAERLLILGFGGNGWNADSAAVFLAGLYPEADIIAFHYRGYAPSEGSPSSAALLADAPLIHDFARARLRPARTVAIGLSIGSGVAANARRDRPLDGSSWSPRSIRWGGSRRAITLGCRSNCCSATGWTPPGRSPGGSCRWRSSPAAATR